MSRGEIYVAVDIEADGPIPGVNSMLNLGMAAFKLGSPKPVGTFEANIRPLEGAVQDPDTMRWWRSPDRKAAWEYVNRDPQDPAKVMRDVYNWANRLPGRPVLVVYPTYDFMWIRWYLVQFLGTKQAALFGFQALDIKTLVMRELGIPFRGVSKRVMPKRWFKGSPAHDHTGLADAIGQGVLFVNLMRESSLGSEALGLLEALEWSGCREVTAEEWDEGGWLACCPACNGLRELPEMLSVGDKWRGYTEGEPHPDYREEVGHAFGCRLAAILGRSTRPQESMDSEDSEG